MMLAPSRTMSARLGSKSTSLSAGSSVNSSRFCGAPNLPAESVGVVCVCSAIAGGVGWLVGDSGCAVVDGVDGFACCAHPDRTTSSATSSARASPIRRMPTSVGKDSPECSTDHGRRTDVRYSPSHARVAPAVAGRAIEIREDNPSGEPSFAHHTGLLQHSRRSGIVDMAIGPHADDSWIVESPLDDPGSGFRRIATSPVGLCDRVAQLDTMPLESDPRRAYEGIIVTARKRPVQLASRGDSLGGVLEEGGRVVE